MSDKKHIDRIFQEKFKDFEATPSPEIWNNIQEKLNQPKEDKKKIFPLWLRFAGVAALLLLMFTVGGFLFNNTSKNTNNTKVVDTENILKDTKNTSEEKQSNSTLVDLENSKNDLDTEALNTVTKNNSNLSNKTKTVSNGTALASSNTTETTEYQNNKETSKNTSNPNTYIVNSTSSNKTATVKNTSSKLELNTNKNQSETLITSKEKERNLELNTSKTETPLKNSETKIALQEKEKTEIEVEKTLKKTDLTIEEAIAVNEDLVKKELDEAVKNRWQVYANVAPVYYNSMGKGSHLDEQFVNSSKTGEVNTSYGVNVSYNVNKKLSVRTGLSALNLSYDTNGVVLFENLSSGTPASNPLKNINLSSGNQSLMALNSSSINTQQVDNALSPQANAAISQRIHYYEIPMEVKYRIGNNKLGFNIIAGFSSYILNDNEVYSELNDKKTYIGEANNINDFSFSTNLGVGLDYAFSKKVKFNLEPTFKYQINAFENTSGNFNPYIIGLYTGFSYKF